MPTGITSTAWPSVREKCRELGISFDDWQHGTGQVILAKREDGLYAAGIGGVVISIPRQVGKTYLIGAIVFALCLLHPNLTVIWTAHRLRTANETFRSMQALARRKKIAPHVAKVVLGSGEEEVQFRNGSRILFGARERGFGVGFAEVDVLVLDEAQRATNAALDDLIPTTNQSKHPAGPLILMMGTPPRPSDVGEVFRAKRKSALSGDEPDGAYIEFSADPGANPDDWKQIAKANPSYPKRTPREAILRMKKNLTPPSFLLEGMGIWIETENIKVAVSAAMWASRTNLQAEPPTRAVLSIAVSPNRKHSTVGVAGPGADGKTLVMVRHAAGTSWVVREVAKLVAKHQIHEVVVKPASQAGALISDLVTEGIEFTAITATEQGQACAKFQDDVTHGRIEHVGQAALDGAVAVAQTRTSGDSQRWDDRDSSTDITAVIAASEASWAWAKHAGADYDIELSIY